MILAFKDRFTEKILNGSKIHTFRESTRYGKGMILHMATGARTKKYNCFNETFCTGTQQTTIIPLGWKSFLNKIHNVPKIVIEGRELRENEVMDFIHNDGFESLEDFLQWFTEPVYGYTVHWTDKRY